MNPRNVALVAMDVLREALFSRYLIVLFGFIALGLIALALSLDLEVVDGALAAGKLFGGNLMNVTGGRPMLASELMQPLFAGMALATFFFGIAFMIVAVADIAPKMLAPGRVEHLLSLPLRRVEIVLGTYVGVLVIAACALTLAIGGGSVVLFVKAELFTFAPLAGALAAFIGFMTLYAQMLAVAAFARSAALSAGAAFVLYGVGLATSDRALVLSLIKNGFTRELVGVLIGPMPRFAVLGNYGKDVAMQAPILWGELIPVVGGTLALAAFCVAVACTIVQMKDY
jgi:Cu-processing system permease protein